MPDVLMIRDQAMEIGSIYQTLAPAIHCSIQIDTSVHQRSLKGNRSKSAYRGQRLHRFPDIPTCSIPLLSDWKAARFYFDFRPLPCSFFGNLKDMAWCFTFGWHSDITKQQCTQFGCLQSWQSPSTATQSLVMSLSGNRGHKFGFDHQVFGLLHLMQYKGSFWVTWLLLPAKLISLGYTVRDVMCNEKAMNYVHIHMVYNMFRQVWSLCLQKNITLDLLFQPLTL